jgi:hypothetical protein
MSDRIYHKMPGTISDASDITDRARELLDYIFTVLGIPTNSRPLSYESLLINCTIALQRERGEAGHYEPGPSIDYTAEGE